MSTILKALEKNKQSSTFIEQPKGNRWMMVTALTIIIILSSTIVYLLMKPSSLSPSVYEQARPFISKESLKPVITNNPDILEMKSNFPDKVPESLVGEIHFETAPLSLALEKSPLKWIEADLSETKKIIDNSQTSATVNDNDNVSIDEVSNELKQRFALAVELEQGHNNVNFDNQPQEEPILAASDISSMPAKFQYQVPVMRYDSHVYSTIAEDRWIRINGVDLKVGERLGDVELLDILPQQSVFRLGKQSFTLESLQDWQG